MKNFSENCSLLLEEYLNWQRENFILLKENGTCKFVTPFWDLFHDHLEISIEKTISPDTIKITDNERTVSNLFHFGVKVGIHSGPNSSIQKRLDNILEEYSIEKTENEIFVHSKIDEFSNNFHKMISAIFAAYQLVNLAKPLKLEKNFKEQVGDYLGLKKIKPTYRNFEVLTKKKPFRIDYVFNDKNNIFLDALHSTDLNPKSIGYEVSFEYLKWAKLQENKIKFEPMAIYDNRRIQWAQQELDILSEFTDYLYGWDEKDILSETLLKKIAS